MKRYLITVIIRGGCESYQTEFFNPEKDYKPEEQMIVFDLQEQKVMYNDLKLWTKIKDGR